MDIIRVGVQNFEQCLVRAASSQFIVRLRSSEFLQIFTDVICLIDDHHQGLCSSMDRNYHRHHGSPVGKPLIRKLSPRLKFRLARWLTTYSCVATFCP